MRDFRTDVVSISIDHVLGDVQRAHAIVREKGFVGGLLFARWDFVRWSTYEIPCRCPLLSSGFCCLERADAGRRLQQLMLVRMRMNMEGTNALTLVTAMISSISQ